MDSKYNFNPMRVLRALQALLSIIALGLLAHVAQWFNSQPGASISHTPNEIAFAIFVSVLTILVTLPYVLLTPRYFPHLLKSHTKHTILVLESLSMILWFASFVSVAAFIGRLPFCLGDVCNAAKAGAGVAAISWLSWGVTSLFALRFCLSAGSAGKWHGKGAGNESVRGGISRGERMKERVVRGLRLHNVWTGHGEKMEVRNTSGDGQWYAGQTGRGWENRI